LGPAQQHGLIVQATAILNTDHGHMGDSKLGWRLRAVANARHGCEQQYQGYGTEDSQRAKA
jgi:hypothetical protein